MGKTCPTRIRIAAPKRSDPKNLIPIEERGVLEKAPRFRLWRWTRRRGVVQLAQPPVLQRTPAG